MKRLILLVITAVFLTQAKGDAAADLQKVIDSFWSWRLEMVPEFATYVGDYSYDTKLHNYSTAAYDGWKVQAEGLRGTLVNVSRDDLDEAGKLNYDMLLDTIDTFINGHQWARYGALNPISFLEGIHTEVLDWLDYMPFNTSAHYDVYLTRLHAYAGQIDQVIELMREAIAVSRTFHNASMQGVPERIEAELHGGNIEQMTAFKPFNETLDNTTLSSAEIATIRANGTDILRRVVAPKLTALKTFIETEYMPNTRVGYGVNSWTNGSAYYQACLKWHLSVDMTPDEVHQKGLDEVKRILGEMTKIKDKMGFTNLNLTEFFARVRNDSTNYYKTEEELLEGYRHIIDNVIRPELPKLFTDIPDIPVVVKKMPYDGPGGSYTGPNADGSGHGTFYANTRNPDKKPKFEMTTLSLHEADPGHHMQISFMTTEKLTDFRRVTDYTKYFNVPFHFPFHTAYTEGWALYAEKLGEEMGVYKTDYELLGRYSSEIFRACRLVVDTGLHAKGWTPERAEQYILERSTMSVTEIKTEIRRYMTWPGQATAYKIGEIKIRELREDAETKLGSNFDVKGFHKVILRLGSAPLSFLERVVNEWVDSQPATPTPSSVASLTHPLAVLLTVSTVLAAVLKY